MKRLRCVSFVKRLLTLSIMAALPIMVAAQTPPRPAVEVRQIPDLWHDVWPADFNEDGRTDLIAGRRGVPFDTSGPVVVRLGHGNGTFADARTTGASGRPVTIGDFDGDRHLDVVVVGSGGAMSILPGRGDGTFDGARTLDPVEGFTFALSGDLNADGKRDLVIGHEEGVDVHPGLGDFTFGPTMALPPGNGLVTNAGIIADLNGDGRRDLAVAQLYGYVTIYLNRGGLLFDMSEIFIANDEIHGITVGDLDRDGDQDLLVPHTFPGAYEWNTGGVEVLRGNGDGTFAPAVRYNTGVNGPLTVVVGHFNGDTLLDVAVGNQSWRGIDTGRGPTRHYWDSVSIFPGLGNGTLAAAATFRLDTNPTGGSDGDSPYLTTHRALKTSDVNGDGRTDLITSPGAIVFTRPAAANRLPIANAGPDATVDSDRTTFLSVAVAEPDWDWLQVEWREEETGRIVARTPSFTYHTDVDRTVVVTVRDARGGVASDTLVVRVPQNQPPQVRVDRPSDVVVAAGQPYTIRWRAFDDGEIVESDVFVSINDRNHWTPIAECTDLRGDVRSCVWRNPGPIATQAFVRVVTTDDAGLQGEGQSLSSFRIEQDPTGPGGLPLGWSCGDVGAVGARGSCSYDSSTATFTLEGAGADIWGTADEYRFAGQFVDGNFSITARVTSVENVHVWTKAGVMIRDWSGGNSGSRHASLFATPSTTKGVAFQRRPTTGGTSVHTAGPATAPAVWLKLTRIGSEISAFYRKNPVDTWTLIGRQAFTALPERLLANLVVSSHADPSLATARFDQVVIDELESMLTVDMGHQPPTTPARFDGATYTIEGGGADVWGTSDQFRFFTANWSGDGTIVARVRALENTHVWAKAGVMFREQLTAASKHVFALASAGKGMAVQSRSSTGGISASTTPRAGAAPRWIRLTRAGNTFTAHTSTNGDTWTLLGSVTVAMQRDIFVGLALTSHNTREFATAVFDDVIIQP